MNRIYIRSVSIFIILIILLVVIVLINNSHPFGKKQSSFASAPKKGITRIELKEGKRILILSKETEGWKVNGMNEARKSSLIFLLEILTEMKIKSPVSPEHFNDEIVMRGIEPVRVKVYENKRLLRSFMVFRTGSNKFGNIMKTKDNAKPFIVYLPGYEGDIGSEFISDELFWMPFTLFNIRPTEISSVTVENVTDPLASFKISVLGSAFLLSDMITTLSGWDTSRVERYLSYFTWVPFESPAEISEEEKMRINSQNPLFRIKVTKKDGDQINLTLWEREIEGKKDSDRIWAKVEGKDVFFITRYFDIDPLLKKRSYFYPEFLFE